jgi:thiosulfate/3-mercaptopyruvate sulfurtransferase
VTVLVSAAELRDALAREHSHTRGRAPRVLDVRWTLDQPDGRAAFVAGHAPGALYVSLEDELSHKGAATEGRHPLPSRDEFQETARSWGLCNGDAVVVYDAGPGFAAARAWWLLRHAGVADVRILDGGLAAWIADGGDLEVGEVQADPGDIDLAWDALAVIDADAAADFPGTGILLDARAPERFRGDVEPIDPVAGHIPGAINAPTAANVAADGTFLSADALRSRFAGLGLEHGTPIAVYCGSGVTAAHEIAALEIAGYDAALYPGSWSQWSNLGLPVEVTAR